MAFEIAGVIECIVVVNSDRKNYFYLFHSGIINFLNLKLHKLEFDKTKEQTFFVLRFLHFKAI